MRWLLVLLIIASFFASVGAIQISEIMYDPAGSDSGHEWVEIYNNESIDTNLTGWKFLESGTNHGITLENGSWILGVGKYAVIADDANTFLSDYSNYNGTLFDSTFDLSNSGEELVLKNSSLAVRENITYNSTWGAAGNGNSLQRFNGSWCEAGPTPGAQNNCSTPTPNTEDFQINVNLQSPAVVGIVYADLFKIEIKNKVNCSKQDTIIVNYNITTRNSTIKIANFTRAVGCSATADTGNWTPATEGNFTICGKLISTTSNNTNLANDAICSNITVVNSDSIACDLSIHVNATDFIYRYSETIDYGLIVNDLNCSNMTHPYVINYEIEDFFGNYLRNPYNSTYDIKCSDSSSHQKQPDEICGTEAYYIKAEILNTYCNDTNPGNNQDSFLIIVKGKSPKSSDCKTSSSGGSGTTTTTQTQDVSANFDIGIMEYPQVVATGQTFISRVEVKNKFSTAKTFEIYSYIFDKQKVLTEGGWVGNKQDVQIFAGQSADIFLVNTVRTDIEPGSAYSFRARVAVGDSKIDDTRNIEIIKGNVTAGKPANISNFYTKVKIFYPGKQIVLYARVENNLGSEQGFTLEVVNETKKEISLDKKSAKTFDFQITLPDYSRTYVLRLLQNDTVIDERTLDLQIVSTNSTQESVKSNYSEITGGMVFSNGNQNTNVAIALFVTVLLILVLALLKTKSK
jgi:uncharacterized protein YneR